MFKHWTKTWLLLATTLALLPAFARADLLLTPTRVLVTEQQPVAQVIVRNTGDHKRTYRMEWREMRRNDAGEYSNIENPESKDRIASPMLRFSPRQVTLEAGETQIVRVQYQARKDNLPGEYRSHLRFSSVSGEPTAKTDAKKEGARTSVRIGLAFSIPVIVRVGEPSGIDVRIAQIKPKSVKNPADGKTRLQLEVTLNRNGAYSTFGDLTVHMQEKSDGPITLVGKSTDFAIFADSITRPITIPLRDDMAIPAGAWLRVTYAGKQEFAGKVLAEQVFQIK